MFTQVNVDVWIGLPHVDIHHCVSMHRWIEPDHYC